jgi:hypothetical protein
MIEEFKVPVIVEIILERVTNISMGTEINAVNEFEDLALVGNDAPTAISCSIKENPMPRFAANLSMLFTEQDFLAASRPPPMPASPGGIPVPVRLQLRRDQGQLDANGLTQVLFNLPAGDWAKGERGWPATRTGSKSSAPGSTWPSPTPRCWATPRSTAWPASARRAWTTPPWKKPSSPTSSTPPTNCKRQASSW